VVGLRLTEWDYVCGSCGSTYALPGADLSFAYGKALGLSRNGAVALLDAFADEVFADLNQRLAADGRVSGLTERQRLDLLQDLVEVVYDPDGAGSGYVISGSPGCPRCGSRNVDWFEETERPALEVTVATMTHDGWDAFDEAERCAVISSFLDHRLDGA